MSKLKHYKEIADDLATYKGKLLFLSAAGHISDAILDLLNRLEIAKKALEQYANEDRWYVWDPTGLQFKERWQREYGELRQHGWVVAKKALEKINE